MVSSPSMPYSPYSSSVAWFALHELLGYEDCSNYDGSWTEWGNLVGAPIETGEASD